MHTPLSSKLNDSSSTDHRSWTRQATISLKDDSESVTLAEVNGVKILQEFIRKRNIYYLIYVLTCLSSKLNDSSSGGHRS